MRRFLFGVAALVGVAALGTWWSADRAAGDDLRLFANRVWVERAAQNDRDLVLNLVAVDLAGKRVGVMHRSSKYAFGGQVFGWSLDKATLVLTLPQSQHVERLSLRTWSCAGQAPAGFDLCAELSDGKNKLKLYSSKGWRRPKAEELAGQLADLDVPECPACTEAGLDALIAP